MIWIYFLLNIHYRVNLFFHFSRVNLLHNDYHFYCRTSKISNALLSSLLKITLELPIKYIPYDSIVQNFSSYWSRFIISLVTQRFVLILLTEFFPRTSIEPNFVFTAIVSFVFPILVSSCKCSCGMSTPMRTVTW